MGIISRLGRWLDVRFPEKINAEEVRVSLKAYENIASKILLLEARIDSQNHLLEQNLSAVKELQDEMNKAKVVIAMTQQMRQAPVMKSGEAWKR